MIDVWLEATFRGGDSARKIAKIRVLEERFAAPAAVGGMR